PHRSIPMQPTFRLRQSQEGSAIAFSLITVAILTILGTTSYMVVQNRFKLAHQTASWQEALLPAEAGVDLAVNEIRKNLYVKDLTTIFAAPDWTPGEPISDANNNGAMDAGEEYVDLNLNGQYDSGGYSRTLSFGSRDASMTVFAEKLNPTLMGRKADEEPYWRVSSVGTVKLPPAAASVGGEGYDVQLRKLDFRVDHRTGKALPVAAGESKPIPQATRRIEAIVKPVSVFRLALFGTESIDMTNHNPIVDSYDSRDPNKSTYNPLTPWIPGSYLLAKRQQNGDIATNGSVINASGAHIYGDASTKAGGTVLGSQNVTGVITDDFYQEVLPVSLPLASDGSVLGPTIGTPSTISGTTTITATETTVKNVVVDKINLSGQSVLTLAGAPAVNGVVPRTYVQLIVRGDISMSGQAQIVIGQNVYVRIFVEGTADFTGNGVLNPNSPLNLQVYGVDNYRRNAAGAILKDAAGNDIIDYAKITIAGNGGFSGAVYAPHYDIDIKGGGTGDHVYASFVGHKISMNGVTSVHYDEALADGALVGEYKVVSWFEDND
ncbi:MAG: DUF7305 domain-containing protein, partial [Chthoniobacteraceae bacterium]